MPNSNKITGVTSALLYFKVTGKSDEDKFLLSRNFYVRTHVNFTHVNESPA